jgi:hypothetical protein
MPRHGELCPIETPRPELDPARPGANPTIWSTSSKFWGNTFRLQTLAQSIPELRVTTFSISSGLDTKRGPEAESGPLIVQKRLSALVRPASAGTAEGSLSIPEREESGSAYYVAASDV